MLDYAPPQRAWRVPEYLRFLFSLIGVMMIAATVAGLVFGVWFLARLAWTTFRG